jgi:hypothetical protein
LRAKSFTLDGEAVVYGPDDVAIFDALGGPSRNWIKEPGQPGDDPDTRSRVVMPARGKRKPQSRRPGPSPKLSN